MVLLKNIVLSEDAISCDYYPEDGENKGFMKVNLVNDEIVEHNCASFCAAAHVYRELKRLSKLNHLPKEKTVYWY